MPNVGTYILTNTDFAKVSTMLEIEFDPTKIYEIQNQGESLYVRAGEDGTGDRIETNQVCYYDPEGGDDLYIAPVFPDSKIEKRININALDKKKQKNHEIWGNEA
jgi:hypothetical protein